jgi:cell division protein FtsL
VKYESSFILNFMKKLIHLILVLAFLLPPFGVPKAHADEPKKASAFYLEQVNVLCAGVAGSLILTECNQKAISHWAYLAGSVAYIAAELFTANKLNNAHKYNVDELKIKDEQLRDVSKESMEASLQAEQEKRDALKSRKDWITAVEVIYSVTLAVAILEAICEYAKNIPAYGQAFCGWYQEASGCEAPKDGKDALIAKGISLAYMAFLRNDWGGVFGNSNTANTLGTIMNIVFPLAVMAFSKELSLYDEPVVWAVIVGVNVGLTATTLSHLGKALDTVDENISKLNQSIAKYKSETNPDGSSVLSEDAPTLGTPTIQKAPVQAESTFKMLAKSNEINGQKRCQSAGANGVNFMGSCSKPLKLNMPQLSGPLIPADLNKALGLSQNMANAMNAGDFQSANLHAGELAKMSHRMKQINKDLIAKLDKQMAAKGGKKNFDTLVKESTQDRIKKLEDSISKSGADLSGGAVTSTANTNKKDAKKEEIKVTSVPAAPEAGAPIDPSLITTGEEETPAADLTANAASGLDEYAVEEADIVKVKSENIFELLSKRYLLSYPKVLKKAQEQPASKP